MNAESAAQLIFLTQRLDPIYPRSAGIRGSGKMARPRGTLRTQTPSRAKSFETRTVTDFWVDGPMIQLL
jgi:hypothetical protein